MSTGNAFAELGLRPDATQSEVKAAWRRLVSRWHPDRNGNAAAVEKMQRINQAYEAILRAGGRAADAAPADPARAPPDATPPEAAPPDPPPRQTIARKVRLTLEEAAAGCTKVLQGKLIDTCAACAGTGHQVPPATCPACRGAGALRQRSWYGWISSMARCEPCEGLGTLQTPCEACDGAGKSSAGRYRFNVRIPCGARHGDLLHVDGGRSQSPAPVDLELRIEMLEHALFSLDDDGTIRSAVPVDGFAWVANRVIEVPTLDGLRELALSRDRVSYVLQGLGFPRARRGPRADHHIEIEPVFADRLSADQNILLDQLIAARPRGGDDDPLGAWDRSVRGWERARAGRER